MTRYQQSGCCTPGQLLKSLEVARECVLVRVHLLSVDARERWRQLDSELDELRATVEAGGKKPAASTVWHVQTLRQAIGDFVREHTQASGLRAAAARVMKPARACSPQASLADAAQLMRELDCGSVPVTLNGGTLVGMITDRDICMAAQARNQPLSSMTVENVMNKRVVSASPAEPLDQLLTLMGTKRLRRIPLAHEGRLIGIVSLGDIASFVAEESGAGTSAIALVGTLAAISNGREEFRSVAAQ